MNEKIDQLAKAAGFKHPDHVGLSEEYAYFDHVRFAELIVRECVRYFNEDYERDFDTLWREDLSKGIKEHFGVEE